MFHAKNLLQEPRPYQRWPHIASWKCYDDTGNPSGHASAALMMGLYMSLANNNSKVLLAVGLFSAFVIGASRVVLGVHSLDQVLVGWMVGAWCTYI